MNWWNGIYLVLSLGVMTTLPTTTLVLMALCLLPVGLLWIWRWMADWHRSKNLISELSGTGYYPVRARKSLAEVFDAMDYPLRDWIMRGYLTGATQYWVRDAWSVEQANMRFTAMEVQTTPGYIGTGIPLWRVRHCALIVQSAQKWPKFVLWRDPGAAFTSDSGAKFQEHRMGRQYRLLAIQNFWVEAEEPQLVWAQFLALWSHMGQPKDADLFAMTQGHDLVMVWRKRPPTAETLKQLLQGCLASTNAGGVPVRDQKVPGSISDKRHSPCLYSDMV